MPFRSLDLFSGVGGITHALNGIAEPVAYCEIDRYCQTVLKKHMERGTLSKAPLFEDVRKLNADALNLKQVDMIVGGWPCQDLSNLGLRKGLGGARSGLISEVFRLTDELKPKMLFLENVPPVLSNGLSTIIEEFAHKRGYEMRWAIIPASAVGAPHLRKRWYCLLIKPGTRLTFNGLTKSYKPFNWRKEKYPRMLVPHDKVERKQANMRANMLGNSVVPDAVRAAFICLASGFRVPPGEASFAVDTLTISPPDSAFLDMHRNDAPSLPAWGTVEQPSKTVLACKSVPNMRKPKANLVLDPKKFSGTPTGNVTARVFTEPIMTDAWSTPRRTSHVSYVLTGRTWRDLPTQARFEVNTPDELRQGMVHPRFLEWLMGYPMDWSKYVNSLV
jgi:site-specific DNA-cytosine methylase